MKKVEGSCHCGQAHWSYEKPLEGATACNCTVCRRYGALWAYGYLGAEVKTSGATQTYMRGKAIEFHFCPKCGCAVSYVGTRIDDQGRRKIAVNLRMADDPGQIASVAIRRFDGLDSFQDLPPDGRCVKDVWF